MQWHVLQTAIFLQKFMELKLNITFFFKYPQTKPFGAQDPSSMTNSIYVPTKMGPNQCKYVINLYYVYFIGPLRSTMFTLFFNTKCSFYPQTLFIGFVRFWEQTEMISVNSITQLVFLMDMHWVFCDVGTDIIWMNFIPQCIKITLK
jgi:hypothetical protein